MRRMTFGSLFAGIGGFDLGLERAGMECRWQVEIDDFCTRVLEKHWPHVKRYRDVREVGKYNLEPVDLICGGFPCQDISFAGKGAGIKGERSGLWFEYARIIGEMGPRYVVVENVAALLNRGMGEVLGTLAAFGYDAEWSVLSACSLGAPHMRERVFIVAHPQAERSIPRTEGIQAKRFSRQLRGNPWRDGIFGLDQSPVVRSRDGIPNYFYRNESLGNAVVPQIAEMIGRAIMEAEK